MDNTDFDIYILENGLMGLRGEAGEAIDILKKFLFQGHSLDMKHLAKELGDVAWYLDAYKKFSNQVISTKRGD